MINFFKQMSRIIQVACASSIAKLQKAVKNLIQYKKNITNIIILSLHRMISVNNSFVEKMFNCIHHINALFFIFIVIIYCCVGLLLNSYKPFPLYKLYLFVFMLIFLISFFSLRWFDQKMEHIRSCTIGNEHFRLLNDRYYRLRRGTVNIVSPFIGCLYFGVLAASIVNINVFSYTAYHLMSAFVVSVTTSFLGYLQFIYLYFYIKDIRNVNIKTEYDFDYPANTIWVVKLSKLYSFYRNTFFFLGSIYCVAVFYFFVCKEYRVLERVHSAQIYIVLISIFAFSVFFAIVVLFPICCIKEYLNIKTIIDGLKENRVKDLRLIQSSTNEYQISQLIISIIDTPNFPFKDTIGIAGAFLASCVNLAAAVVTIIQFSIL